jgi:hypothetical protein
LYSCDEYSDFTYTINDLRYKIPNEKYNDYIFNNNEEIKINHIDYYFKNLINDFLPPMAYLKVQSDLPTTGSILYNKSNNTIYGILYCTLDHHIVIPSIAIRRLLEGISIKFVYSNFYCDYKLANNAIASGIQIVSNFYNNKQINNSKKFNTNNIIVDLNDMMILNGKIKYSKINEWVPIEVYLWYEWFPYNNMILKQINKKEIILPFINFKNYLNIPLRSSSNNKIIELSYELIEYFYEKNMIISNDKIDKHIMNPYLNQDKRKVLKIETDEKLIITKYMEPTKCEDIKFINE